MVIVEFPSFKRPKGLKGSFPLLENGETMKKTIQLAIEKTKDKVMEKIRKVMVSREVEVQRVRAD